MRRFNLVRTEDETGISGVGRVAEGVEFSDGKIAMTWCVEGLPKSYAVYESAEAVDRIHGHNGKTRIEWVD